MIHLWYQIYIIMYVFRFLSKKELTFLASFQSWHIIWFRLHIVTSNHFFCSQENRLQSTLFHKMKFHVGKSIINWIYFPSWCDYYMFMLLIFCLKCLQKRVKSISCKENVESLNRCICCSYYPVLMVVVFFTKSHL